MTDRAGQRRWGADHWKLIKRRIAALMSAETLKDMEGVAGNCHALTADRKGQWAVYLWGPYRLVFLPDHDPVPLLDDGGVDTALVTKIVIKGVVDYHGK